MSKKQYNEAKEELIQKLAASGKKFSRRDKAAMVKIAKEVLNKHAQS